MRIYKDSKTGMYHADYIEKGKRKRPSLHTKNKEVALLKASEKIKGKQDETFPNCPFINFENKYLSFRKNTCAENTVQRLEYAIKRLKEFHPIQKLNDITPALLADFQVHLLKNKKTKGHSKEKNNAGVNRTIREIKTMMRQAERWELIRPQVWQNIKRLKEPKGRVEFHTPQEISQILEIFNKDWQIVVLLGCRAGLRRGEIAALEWKDVDFQNNQIYVAPNKTEKHRFVPMAADLHAALLSAAKQAKRSKYVVDVGEERNSPYFLSAYYLKTTKEKLPFKCGLHKLRHTFASHLVQQGVDLYRVSKLLGHSSIKMTEIYAHLTPINLQEAVFLLPAIEK